MIEPETLATVGLVVFDFDGVFTDNFVFVNEEGVESVRCSRSDGLGLSRLKSLGIPLYIISTETNRVVSKRAEKLMINCRQGVEDKAAAIRQISDEIGVRLEQVLFVGNDINDVPAFQIVGIPVAVADAYPEALTHTVMRTSKAGGHGAVREICDLIYFSKISRN